jgi:hypothetical protein
MGQVECPQSELASGRFTVYTIRVGASGGLRELGLNRETVGRHLRGDGRTKASMRTASRARLPRQLVWGLLLLAALVVFGCFH